MDFIIFGRQATKNRFYLTSLIMSQFLINLFHISFHTPADILWIVLGGIALIAWTIQLHHYLIIYLKVIRYRKTNPKSGTDPVSVIICARNEAENLEKNLPLILNQFYPDFQVVVVDDGSEDQTEEILAQFREQHPNLYVTHIEHTHPYPHGKKLAQTVGIKAAAHDLLLFTDADCHPVSPNWIRHMQSNFLSKTEIVLGYGGYESRPGLLNKLIRADTLYIAMQYLGRALAGKPYMGIGRNLAYRRGLFFDNKGFASHLHLQSGDDDLFINETARKENTVIEIHPESLTRSLPETSFRSWIRQKRRHLTTGYHYKKRDRKWISLEVISREYFYSVSILLLAFGYLIPYVCIALAIRLLVHLWVFKRIMVKLQERELLLFSILYDLLMPPFMGILMLINRFTKQNKFNWR